MNFYFCMRRSHDGVISMFITGQEVLNRPQDPTPRVAFSKSILVDLRTTIHGTTRMGGPPEVNMNPPLMIKAGLHSSGVWEGGICTRKHRWRLGGSPEATRDGVTSRSGCNY